jgi:peptidoglycan/LPS O-acetylase OafA/YrhL
MSMHSPSKSGRLTYIDSMRGVAALLVVLMHNVQPVAEGAVRTLIYDVIDPGKVGVVMFFAISGFVIPFSFPKGPAPLARFLISRLFRLYPAYWLSMAAYLLLLFAAGAALPSIAAVAANITMAQTALGQPNILGVYWTLFIELLFYLICAAAFVVGWLHRPKFTFGAGLAMLAAAAILALARFYLERRVPVAVPLSLSIMFWGTLWREAVVNGSREHRIYSRIMVALFAITIPIISLLAYNFDLGLEENWTRYSISYLAGVAIFIALSTKMRVTGEIFVWFGSISYSLYLFHVHARDVTQLVLSAFGLNAPVWFDIMISIAVAVGCAGIIFSLLERPAIELGHRVGATVAARRDRLRQSATMRT